MLSRKRCFKGSHVTWDSLNISKNDLEELEKATFEVVTGTAKSLSDSCPAQNVTWVMSKKQCFKCLACLPCLLFCLACLVCLRCLSACLLGLPYLPTLHALPAFVACLPCLPRLPGLPGLTCLPGLPRLLALSASLACTAWHNLCARSAFPG